MLLRGKDSMSIETIKHDIEKIKRIVLDIEIELQTIGSDLSRKKKMDLEPIEPEQHLRYTED